MTASTDEVRFVAADRVATITLNRPDDENRMTPAVLERLAAIADDLADDSETQAVIMTGAGDTFFSAGMLHPKVRAKLTKDQILGIVRLANAVFDRIEALPQITIAALNGVARAGAAELSARVRHAHRRAARDVLAAGGEVGRVSRRGRARYGCRESSVGRARSSSSAPDASSPQRRWSASA